MAAGPPRRGGSTPRRVGGAEPAELELGEGGDLGEAGEGEGEGGGLAREDARRGEGEGEGVVVEDLVDEDGDAAGGAAGVDGGALGLGRPGACPACSGARRPDASAEWRTHRMGSDVPACRIDIDRVGCRREP